ncbi:unnamed protein product [Ixodes pacificus]
MTCEALAQGKSRPKATHPCTHIMTPQWRRQLGKIEHSTESWLRIELIAPNLIPIDSFKLRYVYIGIVCYSFKLLHRPNPAQLPDRHMNILFPTLLFVSFVLSHFLVWRTYLRFFFFFQGLSFLCVHSRAFGLR